MLRLRDIRAVLTSAALWAIGWSALGASTAIVTMLFDPRVLSSGRQFVAHVVARAAVAAVWGAVAGTAFAMALLARRHWRPSRPPSMSRWLLWGAGAGLALPGTAVAIAAVMTGGFVPLSSWWIVFPVVGAGTATLFAQVARATPSLERGPASGGVLERVE